MDEFKRWEQEVEQCGEKLSEADKHSFWGSRPAAVAEVLAWLATLDAPTQQST